MPIDEQVQYLLSIAQAGCNVGEPMPQKFVEWITWKLGDKIAQDYMLPYNQKMFGNNLDELGTYWLEKLPNVSFEETLRSCLMRKAYGSQPGHAKFYYPKHYGYGELWLRMAEAIKGNIEYNIKVNSLDFEKRKVNGFYEAENIVTTIPWNCVGDYPYLKHTSVQVEYVAENLKSESHWIYYPSLELPYHRILLRHNFCDGSKGYWTETNSDRTAKLGNKNFAHLNEYAYPLNTIGKPQKMQELLDYAKLRRVFGLGRWGEHEHYNSDTTVEKAMNLARSFV
jgi:UDP-galactopyranose mutase